MQSGKLSSVNEISSVIVCSAAFNYLCLFFKGKYLEEHMVLNMKMGNGKVGRIYQELEELSKGENIEGQRISWLGHLERMEEDRMHKKIFTHELEGKRKKRRPRKGWREEVERDLQVLGVRIWRELVIDREKWRGIVRQAKAHSGLYRQRKKKCSF
jgi:hypothetical protein